MHNKINKLEQELNLSLNTLHKNGVEYAEKNRLYKMELAKEMLNLRDEKIQASLIKDIARGSENVANAEYEMLKAEVSYNSNKEFINVKKKEYNMTKEVYIKEWSK